MKLIVFISFISLAAATNRTACYNYIDCHERAQALLRDCVGGTAVALTVESKDRSVAEMVTGRGRTFNTCQNRLMKEVIDFESLQVLSHEDARECFEKLPPSNRKAVENNTCSNVVLPDRDHYDKETSQCLLEYYQDRQTCESLLECCSDHTRCSERMNAISIAYQHGKVKNEQIVSNMLQCIGSLDNTAQHIVQAVQNQRSSLRNPGLPFLKPDHATEEKIARRVALTSQTVLEQRRLRFNRRYHQVRALLSQRVNTLDTESSRSFMETSQITSERRLAIVKNLLSNANDRELATYVSLIADGNFEKLSQIERQKMAKLENEEQVTDAMAKMEKIRTAIKEALETKNSKTLNFLETSASSADQLAVATQKDEETPISNLIKKAMSEIDEDNLFRARKFANAMTDALEAQKEIIKSTSESEPTVAAQEDVKEDTHEGPKFSSLKEKLGEELTNNTRVHENEEKDVTTTTTEATTTTTEESRPVRLDLEMHEAIPYPGPLPVAKMVDVLQPGDGNAGQNGFGVEMKEKNVEKNVEKTEEKKEEVEIVEKKEKSEDKTEEKKVQENAQEGSKKVTSGEDKKAEDEGKKSESGEKKVETETKEEKEEVTEAKKEEETKKEKSVEKADEVEKPVVENAEKKDDSGQLEKHKKQEDAKTKKSEESEEPKKEEEAKKSEGSGEKLDEPELKKSKESKPEVIEPKDTGEKQITETKSEEKKSEETTEEPKTKEITEETIDATEEKIKIVEQVEDAKKPDQDVGVLVGEEKRAVAQLEELLQMKGAEKQESKPDEEKKENVPKIEEKKIEEEVAEEQPKKLRHEGAVTVPPKSEEATTKPKLFVKNAKSLMKSIIDNMKQAMEKIKKNFDKEDPSSTISPEVTPLTETIEASGEEEPATTTEAVTTEAPKEEIEEKNFCTIYAGCEELVRDYEEQCDRRFSKDFISHGIEDAEIVAALRNSSVSNNEIVVRACLRPLDKTSFATLKQLLAIERGVRRACLELGRNKAVVEDEDAAVCQTALPSTNAIDDFLNANHVRGQETQITCRATVAPFKDACTAVSRCCGSVKACDNYIAASPVRQMKDEALKTLTQRQNACEQRMLDTLKYIHQKLSTRRRRI